MCLKGREAKPTLMGRATVVLSRSRVAPEKLEDIAPVMEICMASAGIDFQFLLTRPSTGTTDVESEPWGAHLSDTLGIAFPGSGSTMLCSIGRFC